MDINQNQTNIPPADSKAPGVSALQKVDEKRSKEKVVKLGEVKSLLEAKQDQGGFELEKTQVVPEIKDLTSVIAKINEQVQSVQRDIVFSVDKESGREIVTIKDSNSDKVIKQIPSEEMLALARNLDEQLEGDNSAKAINLFSSSA